jgi:hypothetical protein
MYEVWQLSSRNAPVKAVFNYLLMVAVTFEVVSLHTSNTLSDSVFPLLKTFLELLFSNDLQNGRHMSLNVGNVWKSVPSKRSSVLGIVKVARGQIWRTWWMVQFQYRFFWPKSPDSKCVMSRGIVMMQDPSIRPKFRSSPTNSLT